MHQPQPWSFRLHFCALALLVLPSGLTVSAGTLASAFKITPQTGFVEAVSAGGFTEFAAMLHDKAPAPPLSMDQVNAASGASVNAQFGLLRSSSSVQARLDIDNAAIQSGQVDNIHGSTARITDTLNWSGLSPLVLDLDLDWSFLFSQLDINVAAGDPPAAAVADLQFRMILTGLPDAAIYSRTFTISKRTYPVISLDSWRYVDGNGTVIEQGDSYGGTSFARTVFIAGTALPTTIGLTFELSTSAQCYLEPYLGRQQCWAVSQADNTGYLKIAGDYTSQNGYSYPGRQQIPGEPVPEPATAVTLGAALAILLVRRRK